MNTTPPKEWIIRPVGVDGGLTSIVYNTCMSYNTLGQLTNKPIAEGDVVYPVSIKITFRNRKGTRILDRVITTVDQSGVAMSVVI